MDCKFRILTKNLKTFDELKEYADGISQKGLIIFDAKCDFLEVLKKFDIEFNYSFWYRRGLFLF